MNLFRTSVLAILVVALPSWGYAQGAPPKATPSGQNAASSAPQSTEAAELASGKKLVLKDGTFQAVRSYEKKGDRVRYYSEERNDWEEIPVAMVDWDATAKAEAASEKDSAALLNKIHMQEEAKRIDTVMDVDASIQVTPGVFLPSGEGMFVVDGHMVSLVEQAGTEIKTDKKAFLKRVLTPIPIVPSKDNVELPGARAKLRITSTVPEFYLREAPPDPDKVSSIEHSSRPGESGPEVELVRATVKGGKRRLESVRSLFGEQIDTERKSISIQRWEVAVGVYRFTLSEPLPPGEYALAEILPDGMNLYVWDFAVDGAAKAASATH